MGIGAEMAAKVDERERAESTPTNTISAVNLKKVYESKARENYVSLVGEVAPKKLEGVVAGLEKYFAGLKEKGTELSQCDACGGYSSEEHTERCPFCDEGEAAPSKEEKATETSAATAPALVVLDRNIQCSAPAAPPSATSTDLVKVSSERVDYFATAAVTETTLQEITDAIRSFDRATSACTWILGRLVDQAERFWQQRKDENGKTKYKSFESYCRDELDMSKQHVNRLRKVAREYTQEQVETFGTTKLYGLLALTPKERDAFLGSGEIAKASTPVLQAAIENMKASREAEPATDAKKRAESAMKAAKKATKDAKSAAKKSKPTPRQKTEADKAEIARQVARNQAELDAMSAEAFTYCFAAKKDEKQIAPIASGTLPDRAGLAYLLFCDANGKYLAIETRDGAAVMILGVDPARYGIVEVELAVGDDEP